MKKLDYTKENIRLLAYIISKATSGSQFTKLFKDSGWIPESTASEDWKISKKSKEEYLYDEMVKIGELGRLDVLDYVVEKVISKDPIYFKKNDKDYKFPRQSFSDLKAKLKIVTIDHVKTNQKAFNDRKLHSAVVFSSQKLFKDGHYSQSIFEACKILNKKVQEYSKLKLDGKSLMSSAFNQTNPKIKLNDLKSQSDIDEQEGFMHIFMGVMQGVRNPKGHDIVNLRDMQKALDYLSLISLLLKRLEDKK